jgi:hypothetical protein
MGGFMQKGLPANAQLKTQGGNPEGAAAGIELSVSSGSGGQSQAHEKAVSLQSLREGLQIRRQGAEGAGLQLAGGEKQASRDNSHDV